jgi:hypothetical protein
LRNACYSEFSLTNNPRMMWHTPLYLIELVNFVLRNACYSEFSLTNNPRMMWHTPLYLIELVNFVFQRCYIQRKVASRIPQSGGVHLFYFFFSFSFSFLPCRPKNSIICCYNDFFFLLKGMTILFFPLKLECHFH